MRSGLAIESRLLTEALHRIVDHDSSTYPLELLESIEFKSEEERPEQFISRLKAQFPVAEQLAFIEAIWQLSKAYGLTMFIAMSHHLNAVPLPPRLDDYFLSSKDSVLADLVEEENSHRVNISREFSSEIIIACNLLISKLKSLKVTRPREVSQHVANVVAGRDVEAALQLPLELQYQVVKIKILFYLAEHLSLASALEQQLERSVVETVQSHGYSKTADEMIGHLEILRNSAATEFDPYLMNIELLHVASATVLVNLPSGVADQIMLAAEIYMMDELPA